MNVVSDPCRAAAIRIKPEPIDPRGRAYQAVDTDFICCRSGRICANT